MNAQQLFARHCEHAERIIVAQVALQREWKTGNIREGLEVGRFYPGVVKFFAKVRHVLVGDIEGFLETGNLQRGQRITRQFLDVGGMHECLRRFGHLEAAAFAALAFNRSIVLLTSTMKRPCVPLLIWSIPSFADTANVMLRPSTAVTVTVISTVIPRSVGARCLIETSVPTESSPVSACSSSRSRQVLSISSTRFGVL